MAHPKTILVTSDLSDKSEVALQRAALLAREHGAVLELFHVVERGGLPDLPGTETLLQGLMRNSEEKLRLQADKTVGQDVQFHCQVATGKDFIAIIRHARQVGADLIVVAAHGSHSIQDHFLGTTPGKLVRKAEIPVLTVRNPPDKGYKKVLVPTDFSEASRKSLLTAVDLAPQARIDLLHVYDLWGQARLSMAGGEKEVLARYHQLIQNQAKEMMDEFVRNADLDRRGGERHFRHGRPEALIPQLAGELEADLVAMGTEGRSELPYILLGSVAEHVLRQAPCDILSVKPPDFHFELP